MGKHVGLLQKHDCGTMQNCIVKKWHTQCVWVNYMRRWSINASKCAQELVLVKGIELQKSVLDWSIIMIGPVNAFQYFTLSQFFMFIGGDGETIIIISWI